MKPQWKHLEDRVHELLGEDVVVDHPSGGHHVSFQVDWLQVDTLVPLLPEVKSIYVHPMSDWEGKLWLTVIVSPKRRVD